MSKPPINPYQQEALAFASQQPEELAPAPQQELTRAPQPQEELAYVPQQAVVAVNQPSAPLQADQRRNSNGFGVAGFVLSLIGVVPCLALIAPVGLALSLIGLSRRPRGLAIAGTILGTIGSMWILLATALVTIGAGEAAKIDEQAAARRAEQIANFHPAEISATVTEPFHALHLVDEGSRDVQLAEWQLDGVIEESVVNVAAAGVEQVAVDRATDQAFALARHDLGRLSLATGEFTEIDFPLEATGLSWPRGVAIDSTRRRAVVMTSHVFQRFYAYDLEAETWTQLPGDLRGSPLMGLAYSETDDSLYAVQAESGDNVLSTIRRFNGQGAPLDTVSLSPAIPLRESLSFDERVQLKYSSGRLVLILPPGLCSSTTEVFAIDPGTGSVASATWIAPQPGFAGEPALAGEPGLAGEFAPEFAVADFQQLDAIDSHVKELTRVPLQHRSWDWSSPLVGAFLALVAFAGGHQLLARRPVHPASRDGLAESPGGEITSKVSSAWLGRALDISFVMAALLYPALCILLGAIVRVDVALFAACVAGLFLAVSLVGGSLGHLIYRSLPTPFTVLGVSFAFWVAVAAVCGIEVTMDASFLAGPLVVFLNGAGAGSANEMVFLGLLALPVCWPIFAHAFRPSFFNAVITAFAVAIWCLTGVLSMS